LDIENASGESILGQGTALTEDMLTHTWTEETGNPNPRGLYMVKFDKNTRQSVAGKINGYMYLEGDKDYLAINYGTTGTNTTYTFPPISVDLGATGTALSGSGLLDCEINGIHFDLPLGTTAAGLASDLGNHPYLKERNVAVSSLTNLHDLGTTSSNVVMTFEPRYDFVHDDIIEYCGNWHHYHFLSIQKRFPTPLCRSGKTLPYRKNVDHNARVGFHSPHISNGVFSIYLL
jgi:hypothetical protein